MTGDTVAVAASLFLTGSGFLGAAAVPLLISGLEKIGNDVYMRFLSEQEQIRIGGVITYATIKIQKNLDAGGKLREDGFFEKPQQEQGACIEIPFVDRPAAEEILEGVLLAAQREHEEKKIRFLGNLLANIAFDSTIDKAQANLLIKIGEDISFRQMCLLNLFDEDNIPTGRPNTDDQNIMSLSQELLALFSQELIFNTRGSPTTKESTFLQPSAYILHGVGIMLHSLMELKGIDKVDMDPIRCMLEVRRLVPSRSPKDRVLWLLKNSGSLLERSKLRPHARMKLADLETLLGDLAQEGKIGISGEMISLIK